MSPRSLLTSAGAFASSHARHSSRQAASSGESLKSIACMPARRRPPVKSAGPKVRIAVDSRSLRRMSDAPFTRRAVADPTSLGLDADAIADLIARAQREIDEGHVPSCQLAFAREGRLALWVTLGDAAPESRYVIFSSTKPVVAGAVWILIGEGVLDVSRRVAEFIPEFASNRKDVITVEQVMLHTSGFPAAPFDPLEWDDRERRLGRFAQWRCNWEPGTRYEYHATSAHWVLAELIERTTSSDLRDFVRTRVIEPLGLSGLQVGVPVAEQGDINDLVATGSHATPDELEAVLGIRKLP